MVKFRVFPLTIYKIMFCLAFLAFSETVDLITKSTNNSKQEPSTNTCRDDVPSHFAVHRILNLLL